MNPKPESTEPEGTTMSAVPFQFSDPRWAGLAKLAEECGEVVQVVAKIIGTGGTLTFKDGQTIDRSRLIEEMGDLRAALDFVQDHAFTRDERCALFDREAAKRKLFEHWRETEGGS